MLVKYMNTQPDIAKEMVILKAQMVKKMSPEDIAAFQAFIDFGVEEHLGQGLPNGSAAFQIFGRRLHGWPSLSTGHSGARKEP